MARQKASAGGILVIYDKSNPEMPAPLDTLTKPTVTTREAAYYLNREVQTLREWACYGRGAVRPLRINGRLAWPVADLRRVLGV